MLAPDWFTTVSVIFNNFSMVEMTCYHGNIIVDKCSL